MFSSSTCANCFNSYETSKSDAPSSSSFCCYHCEEEHDEREAQKDRELTARYASNNQPTSNNQPKERPYVPREPRSIRKVNMYTGVGFVNGLIGCFFNFIATYFSEDNMLAISIMLFTGIALLIPLPDVYDKFKSKIPEEKKCAYTYIGAIIILFILW